MAIDRESIGIPVNFQHPVIIQALAAGIPVAAIAAGLGVAVLPVQQYVNHAFTGGGYSNPRAATAHGLCDSSITAGCTATACRRRRSIHRDQRLKMHLGTSVYSVFGRRYPKCLPGGQVRSN